MASTMNPALLQASPQEVITILTNVTSSRYLAVAGFVVMLYDHFLTLGDEVDFIWCDPRKLVSTLFLFNRYVVPVVVAIDLYAVGGLARNTPKLFCKYWFFTENALQTLCVAIIHMLVVLRVRALYIKKPLVEWILLAGGILYVSAIVALTVVADIAVGDSVAYRPIIDACYPGTLPRWIYWTWVPPLLFETLLFVLTLLKAIEHNRRHIRMPVAQLLYRDGFLYFIVIACCSIFNIIVWAALPVSLATLAKYFAFSSINTMSSRLILNLRSLHRERDWGIPLGSGMFELQEYPHSPTSPGFPPCFTKHSSSSRTPLSPTYNPNRLPSNKTSGWEPEHHSCTLSVVRKISVGGMDTDREVATHQSWDVRSSLGFYPIRHSRQLEVHMDVDMDVEVDPTNSGHQSKG